MDSNVPAPATSQDPPLQRSLRPGSNAPGAPPLRRSGSSFCAHWQTIIYLHDAPESSPLPANVTLTGTFDHWASSIVMAPLDLAQFQPATPVPHSLIPSSEPPSEASSPVMSAHQRRPLPSDNLSDDAFVPGRVWAATIPLPWHDQHKRHYFKFIVSYPQDANRPTEWRTCAEYERVVDDRGNVNNAWAAGEFDPSTKYIALPSTAGHSVAGSTRAHSVAPSGAATPRTATWGQFEGDDLARPLSLYADPEEVSSATLLRSEEPMTATKRAQHDEVLRAILGFLPHGEEGSPVTDEATALGHEQLASDISTASLRHARSVPEMAAFRLSATVAAAGDKSGGGHGMDANRVPAPSA